MHKVLIIEDDADIAENIANYLRCITPSFLVEIRNTGLDGFSLAATDKSINLIVLDIGLPDLDGLNITRRLRAIGWDGPIIMLTARDTVEDRVHGLENGADDYLVKPFALNELAARIRAQLRRSSRNNEPHVLQVADLILDTTTHEVRRGNTTINLNATDFRILKLLMQKSPAIVSKQDIESEVWFDAFVSAETIRTHIYFLRSVIDKPFAKPLIKTLPKQGWSLRIDKL